MRLFWLMVAALLTLAACSKDEGEPCEEQSDCKEHLACASDDGGSRCVQCETWPGCREHGACTDSGVDPGCWAQSEASCKQSEGCKKRGACILTPDYRCLSEEKIEEERNAAQLEIDNRPGGVGCPCGCDQSEEMVAELGALEDPAALTRIEETLRTIGEREDVGYITEAMVQHRLRLLALRATLGNAPAPGARALSPATRAARAARQDLPIIESDALRVQHQLLTYGQTTEIVHGRKKVQRASFRWWMRIENLSTEALVLSPPGIDAALPFRVSRWYVEGTNGDSWDGRVAPGRAVSVLVIGYLGEPVKPGTDIAATMTVQSLSLQARDRARRRWDDAAHPLGHSRSGSTISRMDLGL